MINGDYSVLRRANLPKTLFTNGEMRPLSHLLLGSRKIFSATITKIFIKYYNMWRYIIDLID